MLNYFVLFILFIFCRACSFIFCLSNRLIIQLSFYVLCEASGRCLWLSFFFPFFGCVCVKLKVLADNFTNSRITTATYLSLITGREMNCYTCLLSNVAVGEQTLRMSWGQQCCRTEFQFYQCLATRSYTLRFFDDGRGFFVL